MGLYPHGPASAYHRRGDEPAATASGMYISALPCRSCCADTTTALTTPSTKRFSSIDASYGFDRTATPAIGGSDFVLAWFADTPLSNVIVNTWLGALLFPTCMPIAPRMPPTIRMPS